MLNEIAFFLAAFLAGFMAYPVTAQWLPPRRQRESVRRAWREHAGRWPS